jgi:UDP-N-acetylmuramyl pentapeptide phosphotransferase/UDP-N-acetylglucosamine-1-phosphate transferase
MIYLAPLCSVLVALLSLAFILSGRFGSKFQDAPNSRSLHTKPVSRMGGVGLMAGVLSSWLLMVDVLTWGLLLPLVILFLVSLLDDMRDLPVRVRLLVQFFAAAILVGTSELFTEQGAVVALLVLLITVWMTNLYNFMDGSDGLAGGMALFGFAMYGFAALMEENLLLASLNFSISAAALGFLFYNFAPAKIFMGDAGAISLGFLVAAMGVWGWQAGCWPAWFPVLVFSPFVMDSTATLVKRALRGKKVTEAHCRLLSTCDTNGLGHGKLALVEYALMIGVGLSALYGLHHEEWLPLILLLWLVLYVKLMLGLDKRWAAYVAWRDV